MKCLERVINKGRSQGIMLHPITKQGFFTTSKTELKDIAFAWFGITLAFSFLIAPELSTGFFAAFGVAGLTVGIGFLLHELGHKAVAQYYGCSAEFHAFKPMIYLAIILAIVFKVIFAAPGAVFISGPVGTRRNGIISLAGPVINFGLSLVFFAMFRANAFPGISFYGYIINSWLGIFNMIPILGLDGKKVLAWSKPAYAASLIVGLVIMNLQYLP